MRDDHARHEGGGGQHRSGGDEAGEASRAPRVDRAAPGAEDAPTKKIARKPGAVDVDLAGY